MRKARRKRRTGPPDFLLFVSGLGCIAAGTMFLWPWLTGVPARMTVTECQRTKPVECHGRVSPNDKTIYIQLADFADLGHDIDVHTNGYLATKDTAGELVLPVVGVLLIGGGIHAAVNRRRDPQRHRPPQTPYEPPPTF
jgi:hypothetical protein